MEQVTEISSTEATTNLKHAEAKDEELELSRTKKMEQVTEISNTETTTNLKDAEVKDEYLKYIGYKNGDDWRNIRKIKSYT